ncbi:hypothetical protein KPL40_11835 [Clostridium gasigenes]|uniref:hypothetical protein n=1 Tax=Clostridium gasigenes TaxID=94869 RepID=UPI001C0C7A9A|nr:hypothetical protein [Clostridium gasigenes]MBU3133141.1 hypothetical protein [Clostridium gasigenes]
MNEFISILNGSIIFDNNLIMAIIAINMTIIGLTSLADKKTVIGVDYGDFLIKEFKFIGVRMYYWIIIFALINVLSLFSMAIGNTAIRLITFIFLIQSFIFAIIYFFSFILIENKLVFKEVYIKELLGLYRDSPDTEHFYVDDMVNMNPGTRTSRSLSTNVINFFNDYNSNSQRLFEDSFGPNSLIYSSKKDILKLRKKYFKIDPYRYRTSPLNPAVKDISFEFFQLFRFVENQEKWILDILRLFNDGAPSTYTTYNIFRLYNLARTTAQIKAFGISENLFKYKFLFNYRVYWYAIVNTGNINESIENDEKNNIIEIEKEIIKSLFTFIVKTINTKNNSEFINISQNILEEITLENKYNGFLPIQDIYEIIIEISLDNDCKKLNEIIENILNRHINKHINEKKLIDYKKLQEKVLEVEKRKNTGTENKVKFFNSNMSTST